MRAACACQKRQYRKGQARSAAAKARARTGQHIEAYRCPFHRHWHIGHPPHNPPTSRAEARDRIRRSAS